MKRCLIIGNGKPPQKKIINYFISIGYKTIIAADGGANKLIKYNIVPHYIIGDFDSVNLTTIEYFKKKSELINIKRQDDTDIEKALKYVIKLGFKEVVLFGLTGDRLDHTICNLGIVLKFYNKISILLVSENSLLYPISNKIEINTKIGETISLYGFDKKNKITTEGLLYPITNENLSFGGKESTSNQSISNKITIKIRTGIIFLIRDLKTVIKNDFIF